jgi:soluble lytic murein transglycosylase-like protein
MGLFSRRRTDGENRRLGIVAELELIARRARVLGLALPVLLLVGLGIGQLAIRFLRVREGESTLAEERTPLELVAVSAQMEAVRNQGHNTAEYVRTYQEEVLPVEVVLRKRGLDRHTARRVAWPLVEQSYRNGVDPSTVLSVMLIESNGKPNARSSAGARGLMQVMPSWAGYWRGCGRDLYAIEDNLCNGTKILAMYLDRHRGDERRALLGYNGCVRGTTTPNCRQYPDKVASVRREVKREIESARRQGSDQ